MVRNLSLALCALTLCEAAAPPVHAAMVTYTFEAPLFVAGQTTPLLDRPPNIGSPTFLTSFTSSPSANGFQVEFFQPNPLIVGQTLFEPSAFPTADLLTLTFNTPVQSVEFAFAIDVLAGSPPGRLEFLSPAGDQTQLSANVGGTFQGGTFSFSSPTPFTTFQVQAFNTATGTVRTEFAIDNLTLTVVPEPSTLTLVGLGMLGAACCRWRRRPSIA